MNYCVLAFQLGFPFVPLRRPIVNFMASSLLFHGVMTTCCANVLCPKLFRSSTGHHKNYLWSIKTWTLLFYAVIYEQFHLGIRITSDHQSRLIGKTYISYFNNVLSREELRTVPFLKKFSAMESRTI